MTGASWFSSLQAGASLVALAWCTCGLSIAADGSGSASWSLMQAREFVMQRHVLRPDASELPGDHDEFKRWLLSFDQFAALEETKDSNSESLGLLSIPDSENQVIVPIVGGPAWSAGLRSAVRLMDESALSEDTLIGEKLDDGTYLEQQLKPDRVRFGQVDNVYLGDFPSLRVTGFVEAVTLRSARYQLKRYARVIETVGQGRAGKLVLDLRYCAGGDVFEATDFAGMWMETRVPWVSIDNIAQSLVSLETGGRSTPALMPQLVLVSQFTASACEQLVMGLREYLQIPVVGKTTAGKCSVQTTTPLSGGYFLRISTGKWSGPNGKPCDASGVVPDRLFAGNIHNDAELAHWLSDLFVQ